MPQMRSADDQGTMNRFSQSLKKGLKILWRTFPILIGVILLVSLANALIPKTAYPTIFGGNPALDAIIGAVSGSILAGNPATSYILGGEMLEQGVSLLAVTAFLVAWVTVGIVQLPAESMLLGKKFALTRNAVSFVFAIIAAVLTSIISGML